MFTIEHEFDASVITLLDEGKTPLKEDVSITIFDDEIAIEQMNSRTGKPQNISLSMTQVKDIMAALDLPEGTYSLVKKT